MAVVFLRTSVAMLFLVGLLCLHVKAVEEKRSETDINHSLEPKSYNSQAQKGKNFFGWLNSHLQQQKLMSLMVPLDSPRQSSLVQLWAR
jgi:hypothetical protein